MRVSHVAPSAGQHRRRRESPPRARGWRRVPIAGWVLLACGLAALAWWLIDRVQSTRATLRFVGAAPTGGIELTFFPGQLAFAAPSPPPPLGQLTLTDATAVTVGPDLVPGRAFVRYRGEGIGAGYAVVESGRELPPIALHAPVAVQGRLGEALATWCFGWRCLGMTPVADAEVIVMGGGEHGVELGSARSDAEGRFRVEGVDAACGTLTLRIRAPGFAITHHELGDSTDEPAIVPLSRGGTVSGRLEVPGGVDPTTLRVFARGLPGVDVRPGRDGAFALDHLPLGMQPWLLVAGTAPQFAYAPVRGIAGEPAHLVLVPGAIVRGRVVDRDTLATVAGALVYCGEGDAVYSDADGTFVLERLMPGSATIRAQWEGGDRRHPRSKHGATDVRLAAGGDLSGLVVVID